MQSCNRIRLSKSKNIISVVNVIQQSNLDIAAFKIANHVFSLMHSHQLIAGVFTFFFEIVASFNSRSIFAPALKKTARSSRG